MFKNILKWKHNKLLENKEIDANGLQEITKYKKVILKTQQRFKS